MKLIYRPRCERAAAVWTGVTEVPWLLTRDSFPLSFRDSNPPEFNTGNQGKLKWTQFIFDKCKTFTGITFHYYPNLYFALHLMGLYLIYSYILL